MNIKIEITASGDVLAAIHALAKSLNGDKTARAPISQIDEKITAAPNIAGKRASAEHLRDAVIKASKRVGRSAVNELLAEFGTDSVTSLDERRYDEFLWKIQEMIKT